MVKGERGFRYLHKADDGASGVGEVLDGGDDVGGVEERLGVSCKEHVGAHKGDGGSGDEPRHGCPHHEIAEKGLKGACEEHHPRPAWSGGGVEEAGKDTDVGANVLEEADGVEGGLVVALRPLEGGGIDAKGVG
uniref:Uncharacterized protein n=1 Tax=Nymphaea colorata TaxID=210225 RepID=A0A5K0V2D3_9MAGN